MLCTTIIVSEYYEGLVLFRASESWRRELECSSPIFFYNWYLSKGDNDYASLVSLSVGAAMEKLKQLDKDNRKVSQSGSLQQNKSQLFRFMRRNAASVSRWEPGWGSSSIICSGNPAAAAVVRPNQLQPLIFLSKFS